MTVINSSNFISIRLEGVADLRAKLLQLPRAIRQNVLRGALRAAGTVIVKAARERVPVKSGQLRASIRVSVRSMPWGVQAAVKAGGRFAVYSKGRVVKNAPYRTARSGGGFDYHAPFYAHFVEFGTKPHPIARRRGSGRITAAKVVQHPGARAKPFMGPAFAASVREAITAAEDYFAKRLPIEAEKLSGSKS